MSFGFFDHSPCNLEIDPFAEVVLSVLLDSFKFSMTDKCTDIVWNMAGIRYPTVGKVSRDARFPMNITPVEE